MPQLLYSFLFVLFNCPQSKICTFNEPDTTHAHIKKFIEKFHAKNQDLTIVLFDGSISTDMGYASKRPDSSYRPPCTTEFNIPSFIEEKWRWPGQQFRRYDAHLNADSKFPVFVESGNAVTRQYDSAWDWQNKPPQSNGYNGLTRILSGPKASVSFQFPAEARRTDFIYRTDYLSSAAISVSVAGHKNQVEVFDEKEAKWKEADGYSFSAKEKDELIPATFFPDKPFGATTLRKTIYQKRLKMRAVSKHGNLRITIASSDGARLCYWGIAYSPLEHMIQFINSARGGHDIEHLSYFESWSVDYWKPDLILYSCNTINEGADASPANTSNSPVKFAGRFEAYIRHFLNKPYKPEIFAYILFTAKAHGIVNEKDSIGKTSIAGYGEATVFDFIDELSRRLQALPIDFANAFYHYWNTAKINAEKNHRSLSASMFGNRGGTRGAGFTGDDTHLNDTGAKVGWEYLEKFFDLNE